ncbi:MAG: DUF2807 domain-containing protein [Flavobacterium sp.]|nr:DUF2807 domain-containing protein [Flavobacterium sp.]
MIKFIVFFTKAVIITLITILFSSCNSSLSQGLKGTGNVQTETRNIAEPFTKIEASRGLEVIVEQAPNVSVEVEADQNLLSHIITKVEKGTLIVSSDENIFSSKAEIVRVKMPQVEGISTSSGSSLSTKNSIKGTNLIVSSTSGSKIDATIEYDATTASSTSGSTISISGKTIKLSTNSTSGSSVKAGKLLANDVVATSSSGSSTTVKPLVSLKATASSGSSINYEGVPKSVNKDESSGASISKK